MITAVASLSILAFLIVFWAAKVVAAATKPISTATGALKDLSRKELNDEAKEKASRAAAILLLGSIVSIGVRSAISVIAAGVPIYGAELLGLVPASDTIAFMLRWDVMSVSSLLIVILYLLGRRLRSTK